MIGTPAAGGMILEVSTLITMLGIGLFALPAGIIAWGFAADIQGKAKKMIKFPYYGKEWEEKG